MRTILTLLLLTATALPVAGQSSEWTLEASIFRGALGYARHVSPRALIGLEVGFGFPQVDRTLVPRRDPETGYPVFEEYAHVGVFARLKPSASFEVDAGLRGSVVDLWPCRASDCWPSLFRGVYVQPMVGWEHVKLGVRLIAGSIGESEDSPDGSTFAVGLTPFLVRATFSR